MRDQFVGLLLGQVGQHEGRDPDGTWNNRQRYSRETPGLEWSDGQPWCATFEAWGAHRTGMDNLWPMTASCLDAVAWWQQRGRWSAYPVLGGPFYLGTGGSSHTGVVVAYDATTITTVEGNSNSGGSPEGDGVYRRTRARSSVYGYGVPAYPEGTVSADPRLGGTKTATTNPITEEDPLAAFTEADLDRIVQTAIERKKSDLTHDVLYWLLQALADRPADPGTHPLRYVIPPLHAALGRLPQDVRAALADAVQLQVTVTPANPTAQKGN
ncbi:hypothetical protein ACIQF6_14715 [Kitasatospora sp. NPDC092948]|uniref:hypothetical protein n=1 Tax=Kitasatospora sp. NPDC092948 TaxID=3364088 RepID=UPI00380748A8